jgi:hypothetical protein
MLKVNTTILLKIFLFVCVSGLLHSMDKDNQLIKIEKKVNGITYSYNLGFFELPLLPLSKSEITKNIDQYQRIEDFLQKIGLRRVVDVEDTMNCERNAYHKALSKSSQTLLEEVLSQTSLDDLDHQKIKSVIENRKTSLEIFQKNENPILKLLPDKFRKSTL